MNRCYNPQVGALSEKTYLQWVHLETLYQRFLDLEVANSNLPSESDNTLPKTKDLLEVLRELQSEQELR